MNFQAKINAKTLQSLVSTAGAVVGRTPIPILECALLRGTGARLSVTSTNMDQRMECGADCNASGEIAVPLSALKPIVNALDRKSDVAMEVKSSRLSITQQGLAYKVPVMDAANFPALAASPEKTARWICNASDLAASLRRVSFSMEPEGTARFYLAGTYFDPREQSVVTTNGHVMSCEPAPWCNNGTGVIVPSSAIQHISGMDGDVEITLHKTLISVVSGDTTLISKLIDGEFPDWKRLVPVRPAHVATVLREEFASAIAAIQAADSSSKGGLGCFVYFSAGEASIELAAGGSDAVQAKAAFSCDADGDKSICMNHRYLADIVKSFDGCVKIDICAGDGPIVFRDPDNFAGRFRLAMPMRAERVPS